MQSKGGLHPLRARLVYHKKGRPRRAKKALSAPYMGGRITLLETYEITIRIERHAPAFVRPSMDSVVAFYAEEL